MAKAWVSKSQVNNLVMVGILLLILGSVSARAGPISAGAAWGGGGAGTFSGMRP